MRLNKYLSETGICSRREADALIAAGRVTINGRRAELGTPVHDSDRVSIDGQPVGARREAVYLALNKPVGITCTSEAHVRDNIVDYIGHPERIFPIGRLDKDSDGLILLTNDGDIVNPLLRAETGLEKEYVVTVDRPLTPAFLQALGDGVELSEVPVQGRGVLERVRTQPAQVTRVGNYAFRIILTQGLNRQIRRMCETLGFQVKRLTRVRIGALQLGALQLGHWRYLTAAELAEMRRLAGLD